MIEINNVTKKYGSYTAVKNISFKVQDGEIIGFLGPNGAGKSTTMNMISGYIEPTEGTIKVNGYDVLKKPIKAKKEIGYMPEGVPLYYELTVKEFVKYMAELKKVSKSEKKSEVERVIKETGLKNVEKKLIRNLSRGYKQRVSLAGALIGNPDVLILDEPTVGLDPKQITEIRTLIKSLKGKHTVILSSHILSEVSQICEKVVIINNGEIIAIDTPENLENKIKEDNTIIITVEDPKNNMETLKTKVKEIKEIKMIKDNQDGTKQYSIAAKDDVDLRKKMFDILPKEEITIFELKKPEATLEEAFIKIIDSRQEKDKDKNKKITEKEIKEIKKSNKKAEKNAKKGGKDNVGNNKKRS